MSVYQDFGPGIGQGLEQGVANALAMRRQRMLDQLTATHAADEHQSAADAHTAQQLQIATTYAPISGVSGEPGVPSNAGAGGDELSAGPSFAPANFEEGLRRSFMAAPGRVAPSTFHQAGSAPALSAGPDLFQQNMARSYAQGPGAPGVGGAGGPSSPAAGASPSRAAAGAVNLPGRPQMSAGNSGSGGPTSVLDRLPTELVDVPGVGKIDRYGPLKRQLLIKALEGELTTNQKVRESELTGASAKNWREVQKPQLGDDNYAPLMGAVAGAEAGARMPYAVEQERQVAYAKLPVEMQLEVAKGKISLENALAGISARGRVEAGLQANQQGFTAGENTRRFNFEQGQQGRQLSGSFLNASALANQNHRSSVLGRLTAASPAVVAPSEAIAPTGPVDPRAKAIDAMLKSGMTKEEIKAALAGKPE